MPGHRGKDKAGTNLRRSSGPRALAASVGGLAKKVLGKRGFAEAGLITDWEGVVGPELAASCWPDRLTFPPGRRDDGSLRLRVAGGFALELQHMVPQLLERINGHFGYRAIARIAIIHAPPGKKPSPARQRAGNRTASPPNPAARAAIGSALAAVNDPELRAVLARLGHAVISDSPGGEEE